jgi:hypothetical protein
MQTIELIPQQLNAFAEAIKPYKGQPDTPENREAASHIIRVFTGRLQMLDLSLSANQAALLLRGAYVNIV